MLPIEKSIFTGLKCPAWLASQGKPCSPSQGKVSACWRGLGMAAGRGCPVKGLQDLQVPCTADPQPQLPKQRPPAVLTPPLLNPSLSTPRDTAVPKSFSTLLR